MEELLVESAKQVPALVVLVVVVIVFVRAWHRDQEARSEQRAAEAERYRQQREDELREQREYRKAEIDRYRALLHTTLDRLQTMYDGCHRVQEDSITVMRANTQAIHDLRVTLKNGRGSS